MSKSVTTRRRRVSLLGGVSLLTLLCSGAVAEPLLPAIDIGSQAAPDSGAASPAPTQPAPGAQPAASGPAAAAPLGDWPGASTTTPPLMDGSAAAGYREKTETASGTFWGGLPLQDSPYTIMIVPQEMIENTQVISVQDALKYVPGVQTGNNTQNTTGTSSLVIRGFYTAGGPGAWGQTLEGLPSSGGYEFTAIEDKERVEVLQGVNGFLYGVGNVGGNVNMQLKRPTATPFFTVNVGDNMGDNAFMHIDTGGPLNIPGIKDGVFGYRLNLVGQTGDSSYEGQTAQRNLISGALDFHPTDDLLIQLNASHANYHLWGNTPYFLGSTNAFGSAIPAADPSTVRAMPWLQHSDDTDVGGTKITWKINDMFTLRTEWLYTDEYLSPAAVTYDSISNPYTGLMTIKDYGGGTDSAIYTNAGYAFVDGTFSIFGIDNKVTAGFNGFLEISNKGGWTSVPPTNIYTCNYYMQSSCGFTQPLKEPYYKPSQGYIQGKNFVRNYMIGDEIKIADKLIILAGANYAWTGSQNYDSPTALATGATPPQQYAAAALTPTVAAIYKILPWISAYSSYQQSLQPGTLVENSASVTYTNAGAVLPPYRGTQWEAGFKATVGINLLATAAYFRIDKANIYTQFNADGTQTYLEGGSQVNEGVEFTLAGKLREDLTLFGGLNLINARVQNNPASPWQNGQLGQDASPVTAKLYTEYNLPFVPGADWLHGVTLTGGVSYTSAFDGNLPTSYATIGTIGKYPGYTVGDVGFRYATKIEGHPVMVRFTVTNVANTGYWSAAGLEGAPRTFLASTEFKW